MNTQIPDPFAPAPIVLAPLVHAQSTDAEILAAMGQHRGLLDGLKAEAMAAFRTARHPDSDWRELDGQHFTLHATISRNARVSDAVAPNCSADQAARVAIARALLEARDSFIAQTPNGRPKAQNVVPTYLTALRLMGVHDPVAEAQVAAGAFGAERQVEGPATFKPTEIHKPAPMRRGGTAFGRVVQR